MKLAVVGAGSTYTPELVDGLVRMQELLPLEELALCDPAEDRLAILTGMTGRMLERDAFDPAWPATIVHDHGDAEIWVDREALP